MENEEQNKRVTPSEHLESLAWLKKYVISKQRYDVADKIQTVQKELQKMVVKEWSDDVLKKAIS